ncbi:M3 family oligoendopeptidase [Clostridium sp. 19966]|uniref:M3 family oligoendopeptidase n=1 Tax=Clostridium sp. 19966 TaxID=2768166 RepID=UPI0028DDE9AD|nr:M3 family oligoendopeptidase [Clostridium sp. 19966]MDT8716757.1 M3 family oligoendopeptidase [Clostridium sp. 19966]
MDYSWSLKELYSSFEGEDFKSDMKACDAFIEEYKNWVDDITSDYSNVKEKLEKYIEINSRGNALLFKLYAFSELTLSVDTKNEAALKSSEVLQSKSASMAEWEAKLNKWIGKMPNIAEVISSSDKLKKFSFHFEEIVENSKHILSDKEESVIAQMRNTGSNSWSKLKDLLTSNLRVDIELKGKKEELPLTVVRNLAYDADVKVRKTAYEAELKSYSKIEDSVAACLNGIKGEVITVAKLRGYESPLHETLAKSRMDKETLDAMLEAMKESLPAFRKYYKRKGELLGHKNGLPFYELFAPVVKSDKKIPYEEGQKFVIDNFRTFSDKLADFAKKAIDKRWIDVKPREGKVGGAFCENIIPIGESRIMLNYGDNFTDVVTMSHELGHGYHGDCLKEENILNTNYPMPLAETASTFCETIVKKAAIKSSGKEEAFSILETEISDCGQVIVDIYSRFLFESKVFELRKESSMNAKKLKEIMIEAQKESYGDGLDENYLHPYMWACKPHYYYASTNFYNFPYAFGQLFAKGLYAEYLKRGEDFVKQYDELLKVTGKAKIADVTKLMGIDVHSVDFWRSSLKIIEEDINEFLELSKEF